jgi:hypothetical protein
VVFSRRNKAGEHALVPSFWALEVLKALLVGERRERITAAQTGMFLGRTRNAVGLSAGYFGSATKTGGGIAWNSLFMTSFGVFCSAAGPLFPAFAASDPRKPLRTDMPGPFLD